jgi:predicted patatin/cPLA2 family phospholipase
MLWLHRLENLANFTTWASQKHHKWKALLDKIMDLCQEVSSYFVFYSSHYHLSRLDRAMEALQELEFDITQAIF